MQVITRQKKIFPLPMATVIAANSKTSVPSYTHALVVFELEPAIQLDGTTDLGQACLIMSGLSSAFIFGWWKARDWLLDFLTHLSGCLLTID